jgi:hypothetical protein
MLNVLQVSTLPIYLPGNQVPVVFGEPFTGVTITIATPGVATMVGYFPVLGDAVALSTTGALPTGLVVGTVYYVVSPSNQTFEFAATPGGSAINTSGSQSGTHTLHILSAASPTMATPYGFKPNNTVIAINLTATGGNLQGANDNSGGSGDPTGPGGFNVIVAVAAQGAAGSIVAATISYDWLEMSAGTVALISA